MLLQNVMCCNVVDLVMAYCGILKCIAEWILRVRMWCFCSCRHNDGSRYGDGVCARWWILDVAVVVA